MISLINYKHSNFSYGTNYTDILWNLLPNKFKTERIYYFISLAFRQIEKQHLEFLEYRDAVITSQLFDGTTLKLTRYLNGFFNSEDIYIVNVSNNLQHQALFKKSENIQGDVQTYLSSESENSTDDTYLYSHEEVEGLVSFIVYVPQYILDQLGVESIKKEVEKYRNAGTTYTVVGF